jgi:hypothetical protein
MSIDANALKLMLDTAVKAATAVKLSVRDAENDYFVINGKIEQQGKDTPLQARKFANLDDLLHYGIGLNKGNPGSVMVWVDVDAARIIVENKIDLYRGEASYVALTATSKFKIVAALAQQRTYQDPKDLAGLIRLDLHEAFKNELELLAAIRVLDFTQTKTTAVNLTRNKESVDRSMVAEMVQKAGEVPEQVELFLPVWEPVYPGMATEFLVKCLILIDHHNARLALLPIPGQVEQAKRLAYAELVKEMRRVLNDAVVDMEETGTAIPIYHGAGPQSITRQIEAKE